MSSHDFFCTLKHNQAFFSIKKMTHPLFQEQQFEQNQDSVLEPHHQIPHWKTYTDKRRHTRQSPWVETVHQVKTGTFPWRVGGDKFFLRVSLLCAFCTMRLAIVSTQGPFQLTDFALYSILTWQKKNFIQFCRIQCPYRQRFDSPWGVSHWGTRWVGCRCLPGVALCWNRAAKKWRPYWSFCSWGREISFPRTNLLKVSVGDEGQFGFDYPVQGKSTDDADALLDRFPCHIRILLQ